MLWYMYISLIVSIIVIVVNGFVIWLIIIKFKFYNIINWFILFFVVSDFMVGLFIILLYVVCKELEMCDVYLKSVFEEFFLYELIFNLIVMIVDCYVVIVYFLKYVSYMMIVGVVKMMVILWGILFVNFGFYFFWFYVEFVIRVKWFCIFIIMEIIVMVVIFCVLLMMVNI